MSSSVFGLGCLLTFAGVQGVRDAFFGNVFQSTSFLVVAILAFSVSTVAFSGFAACRSGSNFQGLLSSKSDFAALNATNAAAWLSFFFGLRYLEPAVVAMLYNGIGPLAALALQSRGWLIKPVQPTAPEQACYMGIATTLAALAGVVLADMSGIPITNWTLQSCALVATAFGGVMITISHAYARRFNDRGVGSDAVLGSRFLLSLTAAAILEWSLGAPEMRPAWSTLPFLAVAAFALVVVPGFLLQLGIARATPLAVNVFRALGPVFVFAVQQFDGRLRFSVATLTCILVFCACAIAASLFRGWSEANPTT